MILIDGDTIAYRASASCQPTKKKPFSEPLTEALFRADGMMINLFEELGQEDHIMYFSCPPIDNFRYKIDPNYKIKRRDIPKPPHYNETVDYLFKYWKCQFCFGYEADDGLGINYRNGDILAHVDKDINQIPGDHYNFVKKERYEVTDYMGAYFLWHQMLEGDTADSIIGVDKIGKVKAEKLLMGLSIEEMGQVVADLYDDPVRFSNNFKLLRILRSEEEYEATISETEGEDLAAVCERFDPREIPTTGEG